jgi:GNAT superfamily N-acetyltransferase
LIPQPEDRTHQVVTGPHHPSLDETVELRGTTYRLATVAGTELNSLIPLFRDAFAGRESSLEWLQAKYSCECQGLGAFVCVAFDEAGEAAGSVGLLPWQARYGDRTEIAGQLVDVATSNAHRGRGLFVALADRTRELCEASGVNLLFGFPNEAAYPIWMNKLGYEHVHDLVSYRLPVRTLWAERVASRSGPLRNIFERHVRRTLRERAPLDPVLENSLAADGFACIDHDRAFHSYKAAFGGSEVVELNGGRVWLVIRHGLLVGDLEAASKPDLESTLDALRGLATRLGIHQIVFQASKDTRFSPVFAARSDVSHELPVIYRDLGSQIPKEKLRFVFGDLDNF